MKLWWQHRLHDRGFRLSGERCIPAYLRYLLIVGKREKQLVGPLRTIVDHIVQSEMPDAWTHDGNWVLRSFEVADVRAFCGVASALMRLLLDGDDSRQASLHPILSLFRTADVA